MLNNHLEQAPEDLIAFIDGRIPYVLEAPEREPERPKKRRRLTESNTSQTPPAGPDDSLTLARVDISMVRLRSFPNGVHALKLSQMFRRSSSESHPSPSPDPNDKEHEVLLERFTKISDDEYSCNITTVHGCALFDNIMRSSIDPQTLKILQIAINPPSRRQLKNILRVGLTLSNSLGFDRNMKTSGFGHDADVHMLDLCVRILVLNARSLSDSIGISRNDILDICAPESRPEETDTWSPQDFYNNVHVPKNEAAVPDIPSINKLQCELYPFQKRAVQWLLSREGAMKLHEPPERLSELPHGFLRTTDGDGRQCLISHFWGIVTTDDQVLVNMSSEVRGGILAEEMGLGKTVEIIALIAMHMRDPAEQSPSPKNLPRCSATLIITPPAILQQWKIELQALVPSLNVFVYEGLRSEASKSNHEALMLRCMQHDIVLTTYNVLAREIHYAETPERNLRHEKRYEKRFSPLTQTHWWRVVLDEAQMVESGVSNAAKVAKLIPRDNAWYVFPRCASSVTAGCVLSYVSRANTALCPLGCLIDRFRICERMLT